MTLNPFRPRILIADDDVPTALELEACLQNAGYETIGPALDVQDAIDLIASNHLDAVILDVSLTAQAVHEVLRPLTSRRTPIIFLTGYRQAELPGWAPPAEFCMKPCASADLVEAVQNALKTACQDQGLIAPHAGLLTVGTLSMYPPM